MAGQFSKLGQSLNPTKNRTVKQNRNNSNPHIVYIGQEAMESGGTAAAAAGTSAERNKAKFSVGGGPSNSGSIESSTKNDANSSDSDENDCSIYEPEPDDDLVHENPLYNETSFLPSVGIVMASNDAGQGALNEYIPSAATKRSEDVCTMSITSVTDHINMPAGMLENASPIRARSPAPEIRVDDMATTSDMRTIPSMLSHSTADMRVSGGRLEASGSSENR